MQCALRSVITHSFWFNRGRKENNYAYFKILFYVELPCALHVSYKIIRKKYVKIFQLCYNCADYTRDIWIILLRDETRDERFVRIISELFVSNVSVSLSEIIDTIETHTYVQHHNCVSRVYSRKWWKDGDGTIYPESTKRICIRHIHCR